jgi:hypothetical protein
MGKIMSVIIGTIVAFLGLILLIVWRYEFFIVLRGILPLLLIVGGTVAIFAGVSELKDVLKLAEQHQKDRG